MKDVEEFWLVRGSKFYEERNLPLLNHSREVVFGLILDRDEQFLRAPPITTNNVITTPEKNSALEAQVSIAPRTHLTSL